MKLSDKDIIDSINYSEEAKEYRDSLNKEDYNINQLYDEIQKAREEAIKKEIFANVIVINEKYGHTLRKCIRIGDRVVLDIPPMLMGMNMHIEIIPNNIDFVLFQHKSEPITKESVFQDGREDMKQEIISLLSKLEKDINNGGIEELEKYKLFFDVDDFYAGAMATIDFIKKYIKEL